MISYIMKKIVGSQNDREIRRLGSAVETINEKESEFLQLPNTAFAEKTEDFKETIKNSLNGNGNAADEAHLNQLEDTLMDVLPEAFALVRESARRTLGMRPFDVQMIGGLVLHMGRIAEMKTGEGKTLVAALPLYLNGVTGYGAHLITVNDYLARRDAMWMGPIYKILGLNVKPVFGMKGRGPSRLAFERGEVRIDYQTTPAFLKRVMPLVKKGEAVPIMTWGTLDDNGNLVRDPTFPDLPHVGEVYKMMHGKAPKGPAWTAWRAFMAAGFPAQKMIFVKKGTPAPIVAAWREAAAKAIKLPGFEEAKNKALGKYDQAVGKRAQTLKKIATSVPPDAKKWVLNWLKTRYNKVP